MILTHDLIHILIETNPGGCIAYQDDPRAMKLLGFSDDIARATGYDRSQLEKMLEEDPYSIVATENRELLKQRVNTCLHAGERFAGCYKFVGKDGHRICVLCRGKRIGELDGSSVMFATIQDATLVENGKEMLELLLNQSLYTSEHDELTGLYNRKKAYAESEKLLAEHPDETFAIVHFDLQRFRLYNSFFGEKEGDKLICYIADMFRTLAGTHKYGVYGRIEADVFFLCFPYSPEVIRWNEEYIHERLVGYRSDFMLTGSSGIYIAKNSPLSVEAMFNRAMEAAKKNRSKQMSHVWVYDNKMEEQLLTEHKIVREMRQAIEQEQFVVYLQPKYSTVDSKPSGAEALVRWQHPVHGLVPPDKFIPIFEKNGFIITLDQYMWEHVCMLIRRWLDEGRDVNPISVNVSRISMYSPNTVSFLKNLVERYKIPPHLLALELTESAYMDDPHEIKQRLAELQKYGLEIMMDDFGSGYSSLNTLRELSFNYLKVDRMLLASIEQDDRSKAVFTAIIKMASSIHIPVIAEGVETEEQRAFLAEIGCDYIQGYLFARPMPVTEYEEKIFTKQDSAI